MPAGSLEKLKIAVLYGADAVYMGTPDLSLRVKSQMSAEQVREGIEFAHAHGKRVYLTLNLFSHNSDVPKLHQYLDTIRDVRPDGLIVADVGVFQFVKQYAPELDLHISTQANVCSWLSVQFWQSLGAKLIVLAREVSYSELKEIRQKCPDIQLEAFVHGAMCMTYSGRCLLSNYMAERGANQGSCANSCRWNYKVHMRLKDGTLRDVEVTEHNKDLFDFFLEEEHRGGELMPIEEDDRGSYILNAKDLCLMPKLPDYLSIGIDSLKVEGRGRSPYYVAVTARAYRQAIDDWYRDPHDWMPDAYMRELYKIPNRGFSLAFHEGRLAHHAHNYQDTTTLSEWEFAGIIVETQADCLLMEAKNRIEQGDVLEFLSPNGSSVFLRIYEFEDVRNRKRTRETGVHAGTQPILRIPFAWFHEESPERLIRDFPAFSVVRKERELSPAERVRIQMDQTAQLVELRIKGESVYQTKRDDFAAISRTESSDKPDRPPRRGIDGCCGRGCNGCLPFWYDEKFAKARQLLKQKKLGEKLDAMELNS